MKNTRLTILTFHEEVEKSKYQNIVSQDKHLVLVNDEFYEVHKKISSIDGLHRYICELVDNTPISWKDCLKVETQELAEKTNKLQDYMRTKHFYDLPREDKDLLYEQLHSMLDYLQILGMRCELHDIKLDIN